MSRSTRPTGSNMSLLTMEELEPRHVLSGYAPTAQEQLFLYLLNEARADPAAYGAKIGVDLSNAPPSQPLAFDTRLIQAARDHSADMSAQGYFDHLTPQGVNPGQRISATGFNWYTWGESIAAGSIFPGPAEALAALITDDGVPDLGHRYHLLAMQSIFQMQNQVGIGVVQDTNGPLTNYYTIDTANTASSKPFITGIVFNDANSNGRYDINEGLGNVTITVAGVGSVTSWSTGGYSLAVAPGTYTVTASGGGLAAPITRVVTVGSRNVGLNFIPAAADTNSVHFLQKLYQNAVGRNPSAQEVGFWQGVLQTSGQAAVVNAIEHSMEASRYTVTNWCLKYLGRSPTSAESTNWASQLYRGTRSEAVLAQILGSTSYQNRARASLTGVTPNRSFVQMLYVQLLNRQATATELNVWSNALAAGITRTTVANIFIGSAGYRAAVVTSYYVTILGRASAPSSTEVNAWVNSGLSLGVIRIQFEATSEFFTAS